MKKSILLITILFSLITVSCGTNFEKDSNTFLVNEWKLSTLSTVDNVNMPEVDSYTLSFDTVENRVFGKANCNRYFASYTLDLENKTMKFSKPGSTMMMCQNDNAEAQFLGMLANVDSFRLNGDKVEILSSENDVLATFTKYVEK